MAEQNRQQEGIGTASGGVSSHEDQPEVGIASAAGRLLELLELHDPGHLLTPRHAAYRP